MSQRKLGESGRLNRGICPKCGLPYNWIETYSVGGREYLRAVHVISVDGGKRKKRIKHYLGPADHYVYVSKLHAGIMSLKGLKDGDIPRILTYLESIADYLSVKVNRVKAEIEARRSILENPNIDSFELDEIRVELAERFTLLENTREKLLKLAAQLEDLAKVIEETSGKPEEKSIPHVEGGGNA